MLKDVVKVVPQRIQLVNWSDITMGCTCTNPLVERDGVMACNDSESYIMYVADDRSPAINTSKQHKTT